MTLKNFYKYNESSMLYYLLKQTDNTKNRVTAILCYFLTYKQKLNEEQINNIKKTYNVELDTNIINFINQNFDKDIDYTDILSDIYICSTVHKEFTNIKNILNVRYTNSCPNQIINYINKLYNSEDSTLCLSSNFGEFNNIINDKFIIYDMDYDNIIWSSLSLELKTNVKYNFVHSNFLYTNDIKKKYDNILCNFPSGVKNIIHANCCDKIKNLKLRGTKSEPLILQLIMTSLNTNGTACLVVPNSLLFNDSNQHIQTREYLLKNFNVLKIINITKTMHNLQNYSILYFKNNGPTTNVEFENIEFEEEKYKITSLKKLSFDEIKENKHILFLEKYGEKSKDNIINSCLLSDIVDIVDETYKGDTSKLNGNFLSIPKYINNKIELLYTDFKLEKDNISLIVKNGLNQRFFNYYFYNVIAQNDYLLTTGKLKKIDYNLLLSIKIDNLPLDVQEKIANYCKLKNEIYNNNLLQDENYKNILKMYIDIITNKYDNILLKDVCDIANNCENENTITIQKNSNSAGVVSLSTFGNMKNTNLYYLNNLKIDKEYLFTILKINENKLFKLSSMNKTICLSKNNLENFEIKNIQENIINKIIDIKKKYENMIITQKFQFPDDIFI